MKESKIQANIMSELEEDGWLVIRLKVASTTVSKTGTPDLLALKPDKSSGLYSAKFIEVKTDKGDTSPLQKYAIKKLREQFGFDVEVRTE